MDPKWTLRPKSALQRPAAKHANLQVDHLRADARNRTGDPFITSEVLYQLSYVGVSRDFPGFTARRLHVGAARVQQNPARPLLRARVADVRAG